MVFAQLPRSFSALLLLNRRKGYNALLSLKPRRLFISFARTKETKQRKFAGCRSRAKIFTLFLKKKNSLTLKQLFLLHGKEQKFLNALPRRPEANVEYGKQKENITKNPFDFFKKYGLDNKSGIHERSDVPSKEGYSGLRGRA